MSPQSVLRADSVAYASLTESLAMWTDDYAAQCTFPRNAPVEGLLALYRRPAAVTGKALFTGPVTAPGTVEGLTFNQVLVVLDRLMTHAPDGAATAELRRRLRVPAQYTR
ncbi:hypothetical protein ACWCQL_38090 [Streptomyces sp. NPDC002073]